MTKFDANWVKAEEAKRKHMAENGLYSEVEEHASCGVGLVVSIDGTPSRKVVQAGIDALKAVWHLGCCRCRWQDRRRGWHPCANPCAILL